MSGPVFNTNTQGGAATTNYTGGNTNNVSGGTVYGGVGNTYNGPAPNTVAAKPVGADEWAAMKGELASVLKVLNEALIAVGNKPITREELQKGIKLTDLALAEKYFAPGQYPFDAIVYVDTPTATGTGFMVAPNLMATAAHVLIDEPEKKALPSNAHKKFSQATMHVPEEKKDIIHYIRTMNDAKKCAVVFHYNKPVVDESNDRAYPDVAKHFPAENKDTPRVFELDPTEFLFWDGPQDVALVAVKGCNAKTFMPLCRVPNGAGPAVGDPAIVVGHHNSKAKRVGKGDLTVVDDAKVKKLKYTTNTMGGGSGSPVYSLSVPWRLIGIHDGFYEKDAKTEVVTNGGTPINLFIDLIKTAKAKCVLVDLYGVCDTYVDVPVPPPANNAAAGAGTAAGK